VWCEDSYNVGLSVRVVGVPRAAPRCCPHLDLLARVHDLVVGLRLGPAAQESHFGAPHVVAAPRLSGAVHVARAAVNRVLPRRHLVSVLPWKPRQTPTSSSAPRVLPEQASLTLPVEGRFGPAGVRFRAAVLRGRGRLEREAPDGVRDGARPPTVRACPSHRHGILLSQNIPFSLYVLPGVYYAVSISKVASTTSIFHHITRIEDTLQWCVSARLVDLWITKALCLALLDLATKDTTQATENSTFRVHSVPSRVVAPQGKVKFPGLPLTFSDQTGRFPGRDLGLREYQNCQAQILFSN